MLLIAPVITHNAVTFSPYSFIAHCVGGLDDENSSFSSPIIANPNTINGYGLGRLTTNTPIAIPISIDLMPSFISLSLMIDGVR